MTPQNREGAVDLLQENDSRQLMRHGHRPQRNQVLRGLPGLITESIGWTDRQHHGPGIAFCASLQEARKLLGGEWLALGIEQYEAVGWPSPLSLPQLQQRGLVAERQAF